MHPILFSFGKLTIFSYGFFYALALFTSITYLSSQLKKSKDKSFSQNGLYSLCLYIIIFEIFGARLFFVLTNPQDFVLNPLDVFKLWEGGLVYYGGLIFAALFLLVYVRVKKISILKLGDFFAPALALGHAIGRIGCFLAGCCYGKETNVPWSVVFKDKNSLAVIGVHLHPTQLYEAFGNFLIFILLYFYLKKEHKKGIILAAYFILYAVLRFIVEFFRGDPGGGVQYFGLSISQAVSIFLFIIGVFIVCKNKKKK
ncbi:MAG: prolipoprotein diacylglyceryl transferase [Endomicrobium sp.]|jgi:phosphatidylglycerol:prolipoprotein diacylglycerol transferase|nr:prolipoprotein diacylglyceryl transferase [Endomicrobium sp.]